MKNKAFRLLGHLPLFSLILAVGVLPLIFSSRTTDAYELPKNVFLIFFLTIFLLSWLFLNFWQKNLKISLGLVSFPLALLIIVTIFSTLLSIDRSVSFSGWLRNFPTSLLGTVLLAAFFIALTSLMQRLGTIKQVFIYFHISTTFLSLLGILSAFGLHFLPLEITHTSFWTPGGNNVQLSGMASLLGLVTGFGLLWQTLKIRRRLILSLLVISIQISFFYLALLNIPVLWVMLIIGLLSFLLHVRRFDSLQLFLVGISIFSSLSLMILRLFFFSTLNVPNFVSLPAGEAVQITFHTIAQYPLVGSGPGTFNYNFRLFKSETFNQTPLYNLNFETSSSFILDQLGTIGLLGTAAYLSLFLFTLYLLFRLYRQDKEGLRPLNALLISLILTLLLSSLLLPMNTLLYFFTFLVLALATSLLKVSQPTKFRDLKLKFSDSGWLLSLFIASLLFFSLNLSTKILRSDLLTLQATSLASNSPEASYKLLLNAIRINKNADFLHRQFALTNLALATSVANNSNLEEKERLDTTTTLVKQVLNEAKAATTVNPNEARNWKLYGTVLMQLNKSLPSSEVEIKEKFEKALRLEPLDPELYLNLAILANTEKNYVEAIRTLEKGIQAKENYYPLHQLLAESYQLQAEIDPSGKSSYYTKAEAEFTLALKLIKSDDPQKKVIEKKLEQVKETLNR